MATASERDFNGMLEAVLATLSTLPGGGRTIARAACASRDLRELTQSQPLWRNACKVPNHKP
jgi:hypothetical protein